MPFRDSLRNRNHSTDATILSIESRSDQASLGKSPGRGASGPERDEYGSHE